MIGQGYEGQGQPGLQWLCDGHVQSPARRGKKRLKAGSQPFSSEEQTLTCLGFAWKNHMVYGPGEKRGSRELVGIQAQEWSISMSLKSSKGIRKPGWMNEELLIKFGHKKEVYKMLKQGRWPGMNLEALSKHAEMASGKPKPTCSWIWRGI